MGISRFYSTNGASELLTEHDPMAIGRDHPELEHPPRLVAESLSEGRAVRDHLPVELVDAVDRNVDEVRMVARLVSRNRVRTLTEHHPKRPAGEERPAGSGKVD